MAEKWRSFIPVRSQLLLGKVNVIDSARIDSRTKGEKRLWSHAKLKERLDSCLGIYICDDIKVEMDIYGGGLAIGYVQENFDRYFISIRLFLFALLCC